MSQAALIWDPALAGYDLGPSHPLDPTRLKLSVELMSALGLLERIRIVAPRPVSDATLELVHSAGYVEAVRAASDWGAGLPAGMGLGTEDNPIFPGMHEAAALMCGASVAALEEVLSARTPRAFSIAGGMHHAHRNRAAGFSVYNDAAVAIAASRQARPDLRVLYVDIDAHHGDGVQEAFYSSADVMTVSIHESGLFVFPGTGFPREMGLGAGAGFAINVPLPAGATDECFRLAFDGVVPQLAEAFGPDVVVAQLGVDAHYSDPQTDLCLTLPGYHWLVDRIIGLADQLCEGRLAALGGGGYSAGEVVPRAWAWVMASLAGIDVPDALPESWRWHVHELLGVDAPASLGATDRFELPAEQNEHLVQTTEETVREVRSAVFPIHGLTP